MAKIPQLIEDYLAGPKTLRAAVAGMTREQLLARPVPGKMSTLEVVAHLADFDPIYADRMKRIIAEDKPALIGADENEFKAALQYHERDLEEELTIIEKTRSQFARILRKLPESALERVGNHDERGPLSLEQMVTTMNNHIPHHVKFIHEKRQALGIK
ncbi:MAG: DinB family protein [Planctomycetes bacterium]|nr:DinB family protein [Planctomycetota bacterium]